MLKKNLLEQTVEEPEEDSSSEEEYSLAKLRNP